MSSDLKFDEFQKKYPNLFKEYPRSGFYLAPGWEQLVDSLCRLLEHTIEHLPEEIRGGIYVAQVKEKFGGLRFYMNQETPYISGAIALAEMLSFKLCEKCGQPGQIRPGGYIQVLCDKHHKQKSKFKK